MIFEILYVSYINNDYVVNIDKRSILYISEDDLLRSKHVRVLRRAIKSKRPGMLSDGIIPLHDNARTHNANLVRNKLERFGWETLQHPPYSPDLSPCDFHIFVGLKKDIRGRRFHSDEEVQEWVRLWIHQRPTSFYKTGIDRLVSQWDKCIKSSANYFWIKQIPLSLCSGWSVFIWLPLMIMSLHIFSSYPGSDSMTVKKCISCSTL